MNEHLPHNSSDTSNAAKGPKRPAAPEPRGRRPLHLTADGNAVNGMQDQHVAPKRLLQITVVGAERTHAMHQSYKSIREAWEIKRVKLSSWHCT